MGAIVPMLPQDAASTSGVVRYNVSGRIGTTTCTELHNPTTPAKISGTAEAGHHLGSGDMLYAIDPLKHYCDQLWANVGVIEGAAKTSRRFYRFHIANSPAGKHSATKELQYGHMLSWRSEP